MSDIDRTRRDRACEFVNNPANAEGLGSCDRLWLANILGRMLCEEARAASAKAEAVVDAVAVLAHLKNLLESAPTVEDVREQLHEKMGEHRQMAAIVRAAGSAWNAIGSDLDASVVVIARSSAGLVIVEGVGKTGDALITEEGDEAEDSSVVSVPYRLMRAMLAARRGSE